MSSHAYVSCIAYIRCSTERVRSHIWQCHMATTTMRHAACMHAAHHMHHAIMHDMRHACAAPSSSLRSFAILFLIRARDVRAAESALVRSSICTPRTTTAGGTGGDTAHAHTYACSNL
jgi:myo-inositol catabolism protein IolC